MRMDGTVLHYNSKSVKARSGSASAQLLTVNWDDALMKVGDAKFPMLPTGVFTPEPDGITAQQGDRLVIALGNQWWTPNVVTVVSNLNPVEGQLASYTVQHGNSSRILTNTANQEVQMLHEPGEPLRITGVNYSTGAIGTAAVEPDAGQGYAVSSDSVTTVEGELKTVGGELISGGELKTVCVREEYDIKNAPVQYDALSPIEIMGVDLSIAFDNSASDTIKDAEFQRQYTRYLMGIEYPGTTGVTVTAPEFDHHYNTRVLSAKRLKTPSMPSLYEHEFNALPLITPGVPFTAPESTDGASIEYLNEFGNGNPLDDSNRYFSIIEGRQYIAAWEITKGEPVVIIGPGESGPDPTKVYHSFRIKHVVTVGLKVLGPLEVYCADYQNIDTRYSYTTPIITTDTRRNVYTITVYTSPLN